MNSFFVKTLLFLSLIFLSQTQSCQELSQNSDCQFYKTCLEDSYHCGETGYPIGYGYRYCSKFSQYIGEFSESGQLWIRKTLVCLKQTLVPLVNSATTTCQIINDAAFDSHPRCYVSSGFCELFFDPAHILTNVKGLLEVYEIKDMSQPITLKQMIQTAGMCGQGVVDKLMDAIKKILGGN